MTILVIPRSREIIHYKDTYDFSGGYMSGPFISNGLSSSAFQFIIELHKKKFNCLQVYQYRHPGVNIPF